MSPRFPCLTPGAREPPLSLFASEVVYLLRVEGFFRGLSQWWYLFVLLAADATLGDVCEV